MPLEEAAENLEILAAIMRENSERWFPDLHANPAVPLWVFYSMGHAGEAGEVVDAAKKLLRHGNTNPVGDELDHLAEEMADSLTYLLLLAFELGIDLVGAYLEKAAVCEERWG